MIYKVPEYYKDFLCKIGDCRHSCCDGWPIRITTKEYYYLLGVKCSEVLRLRLDRALKTSIEPKKEGYKLISTDWRGLCMLHREDGLCALQAELGANCLPEVCKLYPRSSRQHTEVRSCSCSNSCEKVVELLLSSKKTLLFEKTELLTIPEFILPLSSDKLDCCEKSLAIIQDRTLSLPERFNILGNYLHGTDIYFAKPDNLSFAFQLLSILDQYYESSDSICEYSKATQLYFGLGGKETLSVDDLKSIDERYCLASKHLDSILPDWEILFEQLIVNHMFFINFPFSDNQEKADDAFLSLATMYSILRFNVLGFMSDKIYIENLVDCLAAMFRLIEHSNFKQIACQFFRNEHHSFEDIVPQLIYL